MRRSVMAGTALIVVAGTIFLRGLSAPKHTAALGPGDAPVSAQGPNPLIPWATGLAVLAGVALVTRGKLRKA